MAFDQQLADTLRELLEGQSGLVEKKMFGGLAFLVNGNMSVGLHGSDLIVRLPPEDTGAALAEPGTRIFDLTGRPMKGWLLVSGDAISERESLARWVRRGVAYASSLSPK